ncbi:hypothetical protein EDD22DRAFT_824480 [Suillus occidentalis]|nr:hypothetical protein EDD22DRAFT_824480 [Suillus occidentalis]
MDPVMSCMRCCFSEPVDFDSEVDLFHFDLHKAVGKGTLGKVSVVEHKRSQKLYALKCIDKAQCIKQKAIANIIQERRLLEEIDHPFVGPNCLAMSSCSWMLSSRSLTNARGVLVSPDSLTNNASLRNRKGPPQITSDRCSVR